MTAPTRMRRSLHFVPGGNERMIAKALTLPADGLILDLEDAVTPDKKAATRPIVRRWLETLDFGGREKWIRMNPIGSEHAESDIAETIAGRPDGYVMPKPNRAEDVRRVVALIEQGEARNGLPFGSTRLLPIATETPEGLLNIKEIAAAAARVEAIDTVYTDIPDLSGLARECKEGVAMAFAGKISIHPSQIEVINREFTPSRADADEALALIAAFEDHARRGAGAFTWKGQMMYMPHLTRANKILARARAAKIL